MPTATLDEVVADLVVANHILAYQGVLDGFGHVSCRHPGDPNRFLQSRSRAPELIEPDDIMVFDLDSAALDGDTRPPYLERFIHGEIYRLRPDVQAVVHSHSPSVIPFAASTVRLRPIYHMSAFLSGRTRVFDIKQHFGCTDMLVRNHAHGAALAAELGTDNVALMRGHGFVTCGASIPIAVYRAVYTERNADLQQRAIALGGGITYLDDEEARLADATTRSVIERPWALWKHQVRGR